jgi:glycosyltransferase involved in cell wall biosynthesis
MKDRRDADELAGLITRVLTDPALRARLGRGALEAAALCTWDRAAEQHLEVYEWTHRKAQSTRAGVTWGTAGTVGERVS